MTITQSNSKIEFANSLRGIAVLIVLFGHYVLIFALLKGAYINFPPLQDTPFSDTLDFLTTSIIRYLNMGPVGVSIFFLVSGLVIPNSVSSLQGKNLAKTSFVIGRLFRIWPTYAAGLLVSVFALWINSQFNHAEFYQPLVRIIANMTLFRDWLGQTQIDGVVWTLEVEAKFYLFILLFWTAIGNGKIYPLIILLGLSLITDPLSAAYNNTLGPDLTYNNFLWPLPFLSFMSIGILFNFHYRKLITTKKLISLASIFFLAFIAMCDSADFDNAIPSSYGFSLALFSALYFFAKGWSGGPVIRFYAKISFPLYACHAPLGYTGMAIMTSFKVDPWLALFVQVIISTAIAWAIHITIESTTHNEGRRIGKKLAVAKKSQFA
jgi:peptidoglycan/LPS O-acetylase OafA/YrhL